MFNNIYHKLIWRYDFETISKVEKHSLCIGLPRSYRRVWLRSVVKSGPKDNLVRAVLKRPWRKLRFKSRAIPGTIIIQLVPYEKPPGTGWTAPPPPHVQYENRKVRAAWTRREPVRRR